MIAGLGSGARLNTSNNPWQPLALLMTAHDSLGISSYNLHTHHTHTHHTHHTHTHTVACFMFVYFIVNWCSNYPFS